MRRDKQKKPQKNNQKWMTTFSDMILLVLVFFVMLFSMSVVDAQKFQAISDSFQNNELFDALPSIIDFENAGADTGAEATSDSEDKAETKDIDTEATNEDGDGDQTLSPEEQAEVDLASLYKKVQAYLEEHDLNELITASRDERGVVLVLQEKILFETGEARVLDEAKPFLGRVGGLLQSMDNTVKVEGHTDSRPIATYRYPSNWELSGARAGSVIRYLSANYSLDPKRFMAVGYGDTRPVAPNNSTENYRKNRRVVIVITSPEYEEEIKKSTGKTTEELKD